MLVVLSIICFAAAVVFGGMAWHTRREEQRRSDARVAALASAVDGGADDGAHAMFARPQSAAVRGNPILTAAAGIGVTVAFVVGVAMATHDSSTSDSSKTPGVASDRQATSGVVSGSLELLDMRDARTRDTLTISGLVRNSRGSADVDHLTAVVLAFGRDGNFLATGRAPLDISRLRPGEESPFVVSVPGVPDVQRYRVTFRDAQGIVRHVDLRRKSPRA